MKHNREFEIAWQGLKPGVHQYTFDAGDAFMQAHEAPAEFSNWAVTVRLQFDRHDSFFRLSFDVGGSVTAPCDRCGDDFTLQLWDEFDLLVKLAGDADNEDSNNEEADFVYIPRSETVLDVSPWVYEFVILSIPLQKVHPDDSAGHPTCNPEALKLLNSLSEAADAARESLEEAPVPDSRWAALKNLTVAEEPSAEKITKKTSITTKKKTS